MTEVTVEVAEMVVVELTAVGPALVELPMPYGALGNVEVEQGALRRRCSWWRSSCLGEAETAAARRAQTRELANLTIVTKDSEDLYS